MNISYDAYKVFCAVASFGSITGAAEKLYISQPAVSQSIRQLEEALGCALFVREPKGVRLTEEGRLLYSHVSEGIRKIEAGERGIARMLRMDMGEIRIGASDMTLQYFLLPYLEAFHRQHPEIRIRITNNPTPQTVQALLEDQIDFALVSDPLPAYKGVRCTPVREIRDILVCSGTRQVQTCRLDDLPPDDFILLEHGTSTRAFLDREFARRGIRPDPKFELATSALIVQFAARGLGIGCVVRDFAEEKLRTGEIQELPLADPFPPRHICLLRREQAVSRASEMLMAAFCM